MKSVRLILFLILLLSAFLRFYKLGEIPAGFHRDEAFLGYNAYSILKTGRDMSGNLLPLHLKSFIYSPAGYSYFSVPFIKLFGLSAFSIRFASALFGTLTIPLVYFLVLELIKNFKLKIENSRVTALLSAALLAVSPWHISLSRTATENIIVTFFLSLGILLFIKWTKLSSLWLLIASFASFIVTLSLYQAPRAFLPLFIPLLMFFRKPSKSSRLPITLYFLTILLPLTVILSLSNLSLRLRTVSLFADQKTQLNLDEYIREDGVAGSNRFATRLYHNKLIGYVDQFSQNYFAHFSYPFLFTDQGLPGRYRVAGIGLLYLFELPLLLAGLYWLLAKGGRGGFVLLSWILLAPIGSSLAFDDIPNLQRTALMLPALSIVSALGLMQFVNKRLFVVALSVFAIFNLSSYLHQYFIHLPIHQPWYRHEGYKELVAKVNTLLPSFQKAIITNRESAPAIFFLFFGKYDPAVYLKETAGKGIHDYDRADFGPYQFSQEECPLRIDSKTGLLTGQRSELYVNYGTCKDPAETKLIKEIRRGDHSVVFRILEKKL